MDPTLNSVVSLATLILTITLAISVPIIAVLAIRFLWDRQMSVGRSRELDKLVWQLHRIASTLEAQNTRAIPVEFVAEAAPTQPPAAVPAPTSMPVSTAAPAAQSSPAAAALAAQNAAVPPRPAAPPAPNQSPAGQAPKAGVNSMFGF